MDFEKLVDERYSVRKYSDRPVEKDVLLRILNAANKAPTGKNLQPYRIYVVTSQEALDKIDAVTPCRFGAGTVLVFTLNEDEDWKNPLEEGPRAGIQDVSIVASHVMFMATELGLGTCWCNYFPNTELKKSLGLPANESIVLFMDLGYPDPSSVPSANHTACKPLDETVRYI